MFKCDKNFPFMCRATDQTVQRNSFLLNLAMSDLCLGKRGERGEGGVITIPFVVKIISLSPPGLPGYSSTYLLPCLAPSTHPNTMPGLVLLLRMTSLHYSITVLCNMYIYLHITCFIHLLSFLLKVESNSSLPH